MRVLITGAGLIGTHTAKELIERGDDVTFSTSRRGRIISAMSPVEICL